MAVYLYLKDRAYKEGTCYPAIFYRLGVGPGAGKLHTSTFNPDEAAIPTGIRFMELLARNYFNR